MKKLCKVFGELLTKDLCVGIKHLQLEVRNLLLEDLCVGVRQLQLEDMNWSQTSPSGWMLFIGARQLSMNKYCWN